ncbi:MAG: hypothetical protein R3Y26_07280 [Rikenellaceae bacterium]
MDQINTTIIEFIKSRGVDDYSRFRNFYMFNETYLMQNSHIADIEPLDDEQMEWILNYFELYFEE